MKHDPITGSSSIVQLGKKFADSLGLDENQQAMHYIVFLLNNFHSALISPSGPLTHLSPLLPTHQHYGALQWWIQGRGWGKKGGGVHSYFWTKANAHRAIRHQKNQKWAKHFLECCPHYFLVWVCHCIL